MGVCDGEGVPVRGRAAEGRLREQGAPEAWAVMTCPETRPHLPTLSVPSPSPPPCHLGPWENCLLWNWSLVTKKLGDCWVKELTKLRWWWKGWLDWGLMSSFPLCFSLLSYHPSPPLPLDSWKKKATHFSSKKLSLKVRRLCGVTCLFPQTGRHNEKQDRRLPK